MIILYLLFYFGGIDCYNEFSSLLTENASIAVVVDKNFFENKRHHRETIKILFNLVSNTIKEEMHIGGMSVNVFGDVNVNLHRDFTVLLSVATCTNTWILNDRARKEKLLHLALIDKECPRIPKTEGISVPLIAPGEEVAQMLLDLRVSNVLPWNKFNIFHDDTFDRDSISRVMRAIVRELPGEKLTFSSTSIYNFKYEASDINNREQLREMLTNFPVDHLGNYFLVIVNVNLVAHVMDIAKSLKMVHPDSQWLYLITDTGTHSSINITSFVHLLDEGENIAFMYNITNEVFCQTGIQFYVKAMIKATIKAMENSVTKELELFNKLNDDEAFNYLRLNRDGRRKELIDHLKKQFEENPMTPKIECGNGLSWKISSAITWGNYFVDEKKNTGYLTDVGSWMPGLGIRLTDELFPHVVHGFRGISLPIITYHNPPWQVVMMTKSGEIFYEGLVFEVMKYLGQKLNFTYEVILSSESGKINSSSNAVETVITTAISNGTSMLKTDQLPEDVIDLVRRKKVLLGACAYTVNAHGKKTINFTVPVYIQAYSFITAKPQELSRVLLFTMPFTKETWACLAVSIFLMGPILYSIHKLSPYSVKTSGLNSSWQCVWYVYGALLQQGGMYLPHSNSARTLIAAWWLIVMVLVATYCGSLIAFLTFPKMDESILTIEDVLAHKRQLSWGFYNGSFLEEYLEKSSDSKYEEILKRAVRHNVTDESRILKRVKKGNHVFFDWRTSLRMMMRKDLLSTDECYLSLSTDEFLKEPIAMIIAQDSPYSSIINAELHRMHESGLITKWMIEKMPLKDRCWQPVSITQMANKRKVNINDMQGIFFVLFMGVMVAIILLLGEFYWHKRKLRKQRLLIRPFVS